MKYCISALTFRFACSIGVTIFPFSSTGLRSDLAPPNMYSSPMRVLAISISVLSTFNSVAIAFFVYVVPFAPSTRLLYFDIHWITLEVAYHRLDEVIHKSTFLCIARVLSTCSICLMHVAITASSRILNFFSEDSLSFNFAILLSDCCMLKEICR